MNTVRFLASLAVGFGSLSSVAPRLLANPAAPAPATAACCTPASCCAPAASTAPAPASCCALATEGAASAEALAGHALRGVIVEVLAEQKALLVRHEEIPGFMRAMTMLLKVDEPTLAKARKGQAITARLVSKGDEWWLFEVKPAVTASPTPSAPEAS